MNENGNTTFQNLCEVAKAILRGKFIPIQAYLTKQEKPHMNNLILHLKELKKRTKPKVSKEGNNKD